MSLGKRLLGLAFVATLVFVGCGDDKGTTSAQSDKTQSNEGTETINVLAAASLKYVLEDIKSEFLKEHEGNTIDVSYIASGKAYAQIQEGSPAHLFIAADTDYPQKVYDEKLSESEPVNYAKGKLVIASANADIKAESIDVLSDSRIAHIAIPNPKVAPYGRAAEEFMKSQNLYETLEPKLVNGESIGQATSYILEGASEVGFTALSMVIKDDKTANLSYVVIDDSTYKPINQALVITNSGKDSHLAKHFAEYLLSSQAQEIFKSYGYDKPDNQ